MNKTIEAKEFIDWIFTQPREKEIKMQENLFSCSCGCLAVQFAKYKWPERVKKSEDIGFAGQQKFYFETFDDNITLNSKVGFLAYAPYDKYLTNFGEVQDLINKRGRGYFY